MTNDLLASISNQLADAVGVAAPSIVQVQGRRRPASGLVYANDVVVTTVRALGREDGLHVRRHDGATRDAELAGWDPTTNLAVLRVAGLEAPPMALATAAASRGLGVIIPAGIAWKTAATVLEHGRLKRGYLGIAGQPVSLPESQIGGGRPGKSDEHQALLVVGVTSGSPAASAGVLIGDIILDFDGQPVESPEDLLDLLAGDRVGRPVTLRVLRGRTSS